MQKSTINHANGALPQSNGIKQLTVLVANRGEIAVRVLRAGRDAGFKTIGIYAEDDLFGGHLNYADKSCMIGSPGQYGPSEAYLQIEEIVRIAKKENVDLVHPGYGYLSENATFAKAVRSAGIAFVGPPTDAIAQMGDKIRARALAHLCGVPTIPGTSKSVHDLQDAFLFAEKFSYPILVKASAGGGGRGMRIVRGPESLEESISSARHEALSAFGDGSVFLEKFLTRPKHIEVQVLGDAEGNVVHLFERDCTVQRKHQKIIEIAPAGSLDPSIREEILEAALTLARRARYQNAGTVEFLVEENKYYFIEMNPRIQVEHTITEQVTGIDLINSQLQIALGKTLAELNLLQHQISIRGASIQCRVTTEVPSQGFRPDTGTILSFSIPSGHGIRVDSVALGPGSVIKQHYDSMILKCISHAPNIKSAIHIMLRSLRELHISGVETNLKFLMKILKTEEVRKGTYWTTFLEDTPSLMEEDEPVAHSIERLLAFLGDAAVNGTRVIGQTKPPARLTPLEPARLTRAGEKYNSDLDVPCRTGWRNVLLEKGPEGFAQAVRDYKHTLITDTTWRDGQQSLLATRVRTTDMLGVATATSHAYSKAYSLECWGGATFDVAYRFLFEDPWERLRSLREAVPNIPFQMLLRSTNAVAYSALSDNALSQFVHLAKQNGIDIFRIFDSLNDLSNLETGIRAALSTGAVVEGAIMYTGDMLGVSKYTLEYYMDLVDKLVSFGVHVIAIKSMSGVMKPSAGRLLVSTIRGRYPNVPIHMHTHDTNGAGVATMLACTEAGADIVDTAIDSISGTTSQPAVSAMIASLEYTLNASELSLTSISQIDAYWAQLRLMYAGFDADLRSPDPTVYTHEIPGGQYSNLQFQARQLGLGSQWEETKAAYTAANALLGNIIKATPTSKAVGDLAQFMVERKLQPADVLNDAAKLDFPASVIDFFMGNMGCPFDGFPEPLRTRALRCTPKEVQLRAGLSLPPADFEALRAEIQAVFPHPRPSDCDVSSYILFPEVYMEFRRFREQFGDVDRVPTEIFLSAMKPGQEVRVRTADGKMWNIKLGAIGTADQRGMREIFWLVNGTWKVGSCLDNEVAQPPPQRTKANLLDPADIGSPMAGRVARVFVEEGDEVKEGDSVVLITAMKMEIKVSARSFGRIEKVAVQPGDMVEKSDLLLRLQLPL
ncbi:pyruvate carboxylase [Periconia macrospinosa]|uniref:Pyruvate carboxylase n=1 Tax=Periconia macrospinosa TaxID=97972 RepID=A0A2V1DTA3_9PLEO|nr:pyruvate carboxylase [Periconia macrospinosa]